MNKLELKAAIARRGMSSVGLSKALGIAESTFFRKLGGQADFTLSEIHSIITTLDLNEKDVKDIFFDTKLSGSQQ